MSNNKTIQVEPGATCVYQKQHSNQFQGKTYKTYCGCPAVVIDGNGRSLCQSHYNRENAKQARRNVRQQLERDGIRYSTFLNELRKNPDHPHYQLFKHKMY